MSLYCLDSRHPQDEVVSTLEESFSLQWSEPESGRFGYLETFDWRLFKEGFTLAMVRQGGRVTLRLQKPGKLELRLQTSRIPAFAQDLPPGLIRKRLLSTSGIRRLLPIANVNWEARTASLLNEDQKTVARIRLQTALVSKPPSRSRMAMPPTLEILPLKGYGKEARAVRAFLWRTFGLRPARAGDVSMAVEALGQIPGLDPSSPEIRLTPEMPGADAARIIHRALFSVMLNNQEGLVRDLDPEFLHDFRVAVRRTRAALGQIRGVFPPDRVAHFSREFRWLGSRTGPTRDMDVYLLKIPGYQESLPGGVKDKLEPLVRFLEHKKRVAHRGLVRTLETRRYRRLREDWGAFLEDPGGGEESLPNAQRPILQVAKERIWKVYRRVLSDGMRAGEAGEDAPAEALHDLRIKCKRLRYLIGFFQSLFPPSQLQPIRAELKRLQETLGDFNDLHVQQVALRSFAEEMLRTRGGPPETLMAMGRLMGQLEGQQEVERRSFHQTFGKFAATRNVKRFRRLFKPVREPSRKTR